MAETDPTREVLEELLASLHAEQSAAASSDHESYLTAQDGQFLGEISPNAHSLESLLNQYGPYGSQYSATSIFNPYSVYGSPYGAFSINNPYTSTPPRMFLKGQFFGLVTRNPYLTPVVPTEAFLYSLKNDIAGLLAGRLTKNEEGARASRRESFLVSGDGEFLGSLKPNRYEAESIFNRYGAFGSRYSAKSIFNRFGPYGSRFGSLSAQNPASLKPPRVYVQGNLVGHLTKNSRFKDAIDPDNILEWATKNVRR